MRITGFLCLPLLSSALASAQVEIGSWATWQHDALTCISTEEFPVVEAQIEPAELSALRQAQVYFKAGGTDAWYFVAMEPAEPSRLTAVLPRPLAETDRVDYYLFFLSVGFETSQSEEFSIDVSETGCGTVPKAAGSPVSIVLRATVPGQSPVPAGFSPQGISGLVTTAGNTVSVGSVAAGSGGAASGGLSGVTIGAVVGGGAAAAAAVAVAGGGDSDNGSGSPETGTEAPAGGAPTTPSTDPSPTPPPEDPTPSPPPPTAPSVPDVAGTWYLNDRLTESCNPDHVGRTSSTGMVIQQDGTALTASRNGPNFTEDLSGTIDQAGNLSLRGPFVDEGETGESRWEATTSSGSEMTGSYSRYYSAHDCTVRWTFTGSKR